MRESCREGSKSVILTSPKVSPGAFCRGLSHKCFDISLEQLLIREFYKALHNSHRLTSHRPCRFRLHEIVQVNMNSFILAPLLSALRVSRIIRFMCQSVHLQSLLLLHLKDEPKKIEGFLLSLYFYVFHM